MSIRSQPMNENPERRRGRRHSKLTTIFRVIDGSRRSETCQFAALRAAATKIHTTYFSGEAGG